MSDLQLSSGDLTLSQIDLMLTTLPVDITFVDENDTVRYFSDTPERIFKRTPAIIGRKVQNCHPPASVDKVVRILEDFRSGKRNVAEFWIQMGGKFIHIQYYAMRDADGTYRGALEVSQDITALRRLEGERRLLEE
jgi:PAS domain S-box-containing protein